MSTWKSLEPEMVAWLPSIADDGIQFRNSYQAIVGFPSDGFRSDGMLTDGTTLLAIEIEAGQTHPDTNTGKYWFLASQCDQYKRMILVHAYTPAFNSYGWRKKLAEFYIKKMSQEIPMRYVLKDYRSWHDFDEVIADLKATILAEYKQAFT